MDNAASVTYRGLTLNSIETAPGTLEGIIINEARFDPVDGVGFREKRSLDDGFDYGRVFLGARTLIIRGTIYSLSKAALADDIRTVNRVFNPVLAYAQDPANKGFLPLDFESPTENTSAFPTGIMDLRSYMRPSHIPGHVLIRDGDFGAEEKEHSAVFEVAMEARDPRIYLQTETEVPCDTSTGSGTVTNRGDYYAPLHMEVILSGSTSGPRTIKLTGFGSVMTVTVPAGGATRTVRIDGQLKVATLITGGVETLRMDLVEFDAGFTWPKVAPGVNSYSWTSTGGAKAEGSQFWFREAWA